MNLENKLPLLIALCFATFYVQAQTAWMQGTWKSNVTKQQSKAGFIRTIVIDNVSGENFTGTKTNEITNGNHAKIITAISGYVDKDQFFVQTGAILYKRDPSNGQWWDCSSCTPQNKISVHGDSIVLTSRISGCQKDCDGISVYYRLLCEYDTVTQRYLVNTFGQPYDIANFKPCVEEPEQHLIANAAGPDKATATAAVAKAERQRIKDSTKNAVAITKRRQQAVEDSLNEATKIAQQRRQQVNDSLKRITAAAAVPETPASKDTARASTVKALAERNNVLLESYHIKTPDILIEIFDNAQIDGDRVSVYHNNALVVNNQTLQKEPITLKIHADTTNRQHEFVLIAENLGTIPPNTALMRVTAGGQTYKLSVRTDMQNNAKILFYYDGN